MDSAESGLKNNDTSCAAKAVKKKVTKWKERESESVEEEREVQTASWEYFHTVEMERTSFFCARVCVCIVRESIEKFQTTHGNDEKWIKY